jgi:hypothetical protein
MVMKFSGRRLLALTAVLFAGALAACSDDEGGTGPAVVSVPTGVQAAVTGTTSIRVTWSQVAGATAYELDRAEGATGALANIQSNLTGTFYEDTGLKASTLYRYVVRAVQGANKSSSSTEVSATTTAQAPRIAIVTGVPLSRTFFADTTYVLQGYVKVSNGSTLTIQPGTRIVGDTLVAGSSLWILRSSKIMAEGTAANPIVFTSQRSSPNRRPGDWGGIIIIGNAPINRTANPIFTEGPTGAAENYAGGNNFNDNSGSLKYVRVEFAGYDVSNGNGQELNTISMYAVGRGTTLDYVQSMAGLDDSFEFWGGGVDVGHLVSFESGDDHFDWTEGYQGRGQYLIALQTSVIQPRAGTGTVSTDPRGFEGDGCDSAVAGCTFANPPYSIPVWANFTVIGPGTGVFAATDGNGAVLRRGTGGMLVNGIIGRWPGVGVSIRDTETGGLMDADSLTIRGLVLSENGANFEATAAQRYGDRLQTNATAWKITTGTLASLFPGALPTAATADPVATTALNLQPAASSPAATAGVSSFNGMRVANRVGSYLGGAVSATAYVGAIDPAASTRWYEGWTRWERK